jgi:hypothetical protein
MKSLERRFNNITEKNIFWSSFICFAEAVKGQRFTPSILHRWFQKLVQKDDYAQSDKRTLLRHLDFLSNPLRTTGNEGKNARQ